MSSLIEHSELAHQLYEGLVRRIEGHRASYLLLGGTLSELKNRNLFKKSTGEIGQWYDFLRQPEIAISPLEAQRLIDIHDLLLVKHGVPIEDLGKVPPKSLTHIVNLVKGGVDPKDLIDKATHLTVSDFKESVVEDKPIQVERTYTFMVMRKCNETGTMQKVHGIPSEQIVTELKINDTN